MWLFLVFLRVKFEGANGFALRGPNPGSWQKKQLVPFPRLVASRNEITD